MYRLDASCATPGVLVRSFGLCIWFIPWLIVSSTTAPWSQAQDNNSAESLPNKEVRNDTRIAVENALLKTLETTTISAEVAGRIAELNIQEGNRVRAGQLLGKVNDRAVLLQLQQAKTALTRAQLKHQSDIELRLAKTRTEVSKNELDRAVAANERLADTFPLKEVERLKLVYQTNLLEVERATHDRRVGELEVQQAEDQLRTSGELVERHQIRSPVDGMIVALHRRQGEWVEPGTNVLQVVKLSRLRIEGFISASMAANVNADCKARVTLTQGKQKFQREASVSFVSPEVNPVTGQVRIYLELPNEDLTLRPGMRAEAEILVPSIEP